jgi:hypothetical protein
VESPGRELLGNLQTWRLVQRRRLLRWNSWTSIQRKRLESFALCYSQSLLLADFKENHTKKSVKQENSSIFKISIL